MLRFTLFLISVVFLDCIVAAPLSRIASGCKQGCPTTSKGSKLRYQPGHVYNYNFDSTVSISLTGNDPQDIQLQVQGTARVSGISGCHYGLDVHDVTLIGPDKAKTRFNNKVELEKTVQFTLANDKLDSEICTSPDDTDVSLNIKRAFISQLQLGDSGSVDEDDVFGTCHTTYSVDKHDDGSFIVTKTRDLNSCSHRETFINGFITGVFNENSHIKSTPLLNGDYTNEVRVNSHGIVESAQVLEDYTLVPFSNGEAGVRARVVTQFRLKDQKAQFDARLSGPPSVSVPRSLHYETVEKPQAVSYKIAKKSLFGICESFAQRKSVGPQVAGQFIETIRLLRYLKKDDILLLFKEANQAKENPICRKAFLDAVFRVGTADSVNAIASLLENKQIHEKRLAYLSFNLATSVNKETISIVTKLLDKENLKEGYLSIGNLIKKYTQQEEDSPELQRLFDKLADKLGNCKSERRQQEDVYVAILKGLRGAHGVSNHLVDKLIKCSSEGHAGRIRAAAIQAFPAFSGSSQITPAALRILKNRHDDSEFRIEAYLALVSFSTPQIAGEVARLLEDEPVFQVGSFIASHLANLKASTDLHREKARQDFADVFASKKFTSDLRKYSFNSEFSYTFGSLGLGGSIDSDVIYSQNSFVPRSVRTNITGEIFGTSFNIFEVSGRQENFDLILERYFGPKGYFNTVDKKEALRKVHYFFQGGEPKRHKRGLAQDAQQFGSEYAGGVNKDVDFDLTVKMFGTNLYFLTMGDNFPTESKDFTKEFGKFLQNFLKASKEGKKHQYDVHSLFLDVEFSYPTSSGFPLRIQSQGSGAFHLEATLKADFKEIQTNPTNTKFAIGVVPSYNLELTGIISVDGYEVSTGIKVTSNVHSATGSALTFELVNQGKGVDIKVDFPFKKQELLSFDHKVVFVQQNLGHESIQHNLKSSQKKDVVTRNDCFDQFNKYLGVTVCYELSTKKGEKLANSRLFPLNGPAHVSAYVEIEQQYHFSAIYDDSTPAKRSLEFIFDTPQSQSTRRIAIKFEGAVNPKPYLSASFDSPYKQAKAEVGVTNDDKELIVYGQANNDAEQYLLKFGFRKGGSGSRREYTPIIEYNNPEAIPYKVSGKVIADSSHSPKTKYTFERLTVEPANQEGKFGPLSVSGWFEHAGSHRFDTDLDIRYKDNSAQVKGHVAAEKDGLDLDLSLLSDLSEFANGRIKLEVSRSENHGRQSFLVIYGRDLESTTKRIEFTTDYQYQKEGDSYNSLNAKHTYIISPIQAKIILNVGAHKDHFDYDFLTEYSKYTIKSNLLADVNQKSKGDWNVKFGGFLNTHGFDFASTRSIDEKADRSTIKHELNSSFGTHVVLNAKFDNTVHIHKADITADGSVVLARGQKPFKFDFKHLATSKSSQTNGKLTADNSEIATFNAVLNRNAGDPNAPITGTLDVNVPDLITAHGNYHTVKGNGKSDLVVSFAKIDRKLKVDTKYDYKPNKFDLHNDFYYDFEKDNSRHIAFDTKNKYTSTSFDSVNEVDVNGEKFQFNIDGSKSGDLRNGKHTGNFLLRLPTHREFTGTLNRQVDISAPNGHGHGNIKLTDTVTQGSTRKTRSIEIDGTLKDYNRALRLFDLVHKFTYTGYDGHPIVLDSHVNHLPKGNFKSALASLKISGGVAHPLEISVGIDEYSDDHAVYNANVKYDNAGSLHLNGDYNIGEVGQRPSTFKLSGQASVPKTKLEHLSFDTRGSLKYPDPKNANGQYDYDFKFNAKLNEKNVNVDTKGHFGKSNGDLSFNVKVPQTDSIALDVDYNYDHQADQQSHQATGNVQVRYGNGKNIKFSGDAKVTEGHEITLHGSIHTPYEKVKSLDASFKAVKKDEESYSTDAELSVDNKKYKLSSAVVYSQLNPSFTLDVYYPPDKHSQIAIHVTRAHDRKYQLSVRLVNLNNFNLNGDLELSYQSVENFGVVIDLDSPALKANKLHVDIHTKQAGNNKGIEFVATQQNRNVISGFADYTVKQEKGKTTIEGKGTVNWHDKPNSLTYQFVRSTFNQAENQETGVSLVFNGQIGPKNVQAELKLTNREFHLQHTICESQGSDKPCIHLKVNSLLSNVSLKKFTHNLLVTVDLRPLDFANEFNLKADTKRDGYQIEHTFDTQIQTADHSKYQFNAYLKPSQAGIVLSIPKRTAAIEASFSYPREFIGVYQATITSYLDKKNDPARHSTIGFRGEIQRPSKYTFITSGALTASHPSTKDLVISGQSEFNGEQQSLTGSIKFDVFRNTDQAIVVAAQYTNSEPSVKGFNVTSVVSLKSPGLGLDWECYENAGVSYTSRAINYKTEFRGPTQDERFGFSVFADTEHVDSSFVVFNEELLKAGAEYDPSKRAATVHSNIKLLGSEPIHSHATISLSSAYAHVKQGNFLSIEADAAAGKALTFTATGNQKQLVHIKVALDNAHLFSTDYQVNNKDFKEFLQHAKDKTVEDAKHARAEFEQRVIKAKNSLTSQVNNIKKNLPDFTRVSNDYKEEYEQFSKDLLNDHSIKAFIEFFQNIHDILQRTVGEISDTLNQHFDEITKSVNELFKNLYDGFNERLLPTLRESYEQIERSLSHLFEEVFNTALHLFEKLVDKLKSFEGDFRKYSESLSKFTKKFNDIFKDQWVVVQRELEDIYNLIVTHLNSLSGFEGIKEKYSEFIQRIPVSDAEEFKKLAQKAFETVKSWFLMAHSQLNSWGVDSADEYYGLPFAWFQKNAHILPQLATLRLSAVNYLFNEPLPSLKDLLLTYRPDAFNPINFLPPFPIQGQIVDGEYLFTFSGDQITLPGACQYVLAKDIVDGNFTVVGKIANHQLQSIAIADKSGESIEIAANGKVTVNDKPAEFPVHEQTLYAWRTYYSVHILSNYGVDVHCKLDLNSCHVNVNGFYFNKLRGLLGKGGYEQFDANALPNGNAPQTLSQFANAYKLDNCPDVSVNEQHRHATDDSHSAECENVFGSGSSLRHCGYIIDPSHYLGACHHAVSTAANKQEAACNIAFGYASECQRQFIPVVLPSVCQKCQVTDDAGAVQSYAIGDTYNPHTAKKADVVFVVDTALEAKLLTDLVQHFIVDLRHSLKKDFDTRVSVIGYKKGEKYLSHYTTEGQLDIDKFHLAKKPEYAPHEDDYTIGCPQVDAVLQSLYNSTYQLADQLSLLADGRAFREALRYPFRSNAHRTIIAIRSDVLQYSTNPIKLLGAKAANEIARKLGINIHLVSPIEDLHFNNNKEVNNVVGFSDKTVLYMPPQKASHQDRPHLEYGSDLGIDMVNENHGFAFNLNNYNGLDAANQRKFLRVAASHIAQQITKTESVHECVCSLHHGLFAREVCVETDRTTKTRK